MRIGKSVFGTVACGLIAVWGAACASNPSSREDPMAATGGSAGAPLASAAGSGGMVVALGGSPNGGTGSVTVIAGTGGTAPSAGAGGSVAVAGAGGSGPTSRPKLRTVGYLPSYRGSLAVLSSTFDFSMVSYVNVCFGNVDDSGNVTYDAALPMFTAAAHAAGAKVCMALGGSTTIMSLGPLAAQIAPAGRAGFVTKITNFAMTSGLDCIDIDFEGGGVNQDYEGFVTALGPALHAQGKQMSAAVGSWFGSNITDGALAAFDFVNVMAYDLHNPYGTATPVQSASMADSQAEIGYWVNTRHLSKDKAIFGVPLYGLSWGPGATGGTAVTYAQLLSTYGAAAANDEITQNGTTIYLNSRATIVAKAQLAAQYGGIMVWELGQDATTPATSLMHAIHDAP